MLEAPPLETDGRRARREQNRAAVVEAVLQLHLEGNLYPSTVEIAERAGLSPRSLFRYFEDVDDLVRTAIGVQQERARPLAEVAAGPGDPIEVRIAALVGSRADLWERLGPAARVVRLKAPSQPVVLEELERARAFLRAQIVELFEPELAALEPLPRAGLLGAVDVLCSFESWDLLRNDQGLSRRRAASALSEALGSLFAPRGGG